MSGDWIKMRVALHDDPSVISIAADTGLDEDTVVGKLHRLWSWADRHLANSNADSVTVSVTSSWLDRYVSVSGFAEAMQNAGWLVIRDKSITFPNFHRHNLKTGKERSLSAVRQRKHRENSNGDRNGATVTGALPTEEKRREDLESTIVDSLTQFGPKFLRMTVEEMAKLVTDFGQPLIDQELREADEWIEKSQTPNGRKYRKPKHNHYLFFRGWLKDKRLKNGHANGAPRKGRIDPGTGYGENFMAGMSLVERIKQEEERHQ